jgi:hypothetical protein
MTLSNYFKHHECVLEKFWFDYLGGRYVGRGIMTWKPETGFHIEAPLKRQKLPQPEMVKLGKVGIVRKSNTSSIRMKPWYCDWAFSPAIPLVDREDILSQHRFSTNLNSAIFLNTHDHIDHSLKYIGSSLYEIKDADFLFDFVTRGGVEVADHSLKSRTRDLKGIFHQGDQGEEIKGYLIDDRYLELYWQFPKAIFSKEYCWKWSEAVQFSLSILLGQTVNLLYRELSFGNRTRSEFKRQQSHGFLRLYYHQYGKEEIKATKIYFLKLTNFLACKSEGSSICINVLKQVTEASQQKNWQTRELLLSTILEAVLRNVDNQPFQVKKSGSKSWNIRESLDKFFQKYLPSEIWQQFRERVMQERNYLRHRNAHPDWLFSQGGALSEEEKEKALDSMIFLSRFYGYIILSLAEVENLEPLFPRPHKDWGATITLQPPKLKQEFIDRPDDLME